LLLNDKRMNGVNVDIQSLHGILKNPIRRKIVLSLHEKKELTYTELMNLVKVQNTGKFNYHLKILGDLVKKNQDEKYQLAEKGEIAAQMLLRFPEHKPSSKAERFLFERDDAVKLHVILASLPYILLFQSFALLVIAPPLAIEYFVEERKKAFHLIIAWGLILYSFLFILQIATGYYPDLVFSLTHFPIEVLSYPLQMAIVLLSAMILYIRKWDIPQLSLVVTNLAGLSTILSIMLSMLAYLLTNPSQFFSNIPSFWITGVFFLFPLASYGIYRYLSLRQRKCPNIDQ
jgi:hypothetical protein